MGASLAAGSYGRYWSEERVLAGIFRYLASAEATLPLQDEILLGGVEDKDVSNARATWNSLAMANEPIEAFKSAWDAPITTAAYNAILARCALPVDQARLKALTTPHAGDWLHAPPLTAVGLRLSDEAIRVATGFASAR